MCCCLPGAPGLGAALPPGCGHADGLAGRLLLQTDAGGPRALPARLQMTAHNEHAEGNVDVLLVCSLQVGGHGVRDMCKDYTAILGTFVLNKYIHVIHVVDDISFECLHSQF